MTLLGPKAIGYGGTVLLYTVKQPDTGAASLLFGQVAGN
jgi:hypothetical protein